jgi:hypothetical protein
MTPDQHATEAAKLLSSDYTDAENRTNSLLAAVAHAILSLRPAPAPATPSVPESPGFTVAAEEHREARLSDPGGSALDHKPDFKTAEQYGGHVPTNEVVEYPGDEPEGFDGYPDDGITQR